MNQKEPISKQDLPLPVNNTGDGAMAHVRLKKTDLDILIEILQLVYDYKAVALSKPAWLKFSQDYLPKILDQMSRNEFNCNDVNNNSPTWLIDQVCWSRQLIYGVPHREGIPLSDTQLGQQALHILRPASRGQQSYDLYTRPTTFNELFDYQ